MHLKSTTRGSAIKRTIFMVALATVVCFIMASPFAAIKINEAQAYDFSGSLAKIANKSGLNPYAADKLVPLPALIGAIINAGLSVIGVVCLVIIIIAGYRWMMAEGSEETITKARHSIKSAVIGVIIVLASYAITYYVINALLSSGGGGSFDQYERRTAPTTPDLGLGYYCEQLNCSVFTEQECSQPKDINTGADCCRNQYEIEPVFGGPDIKKWLFCENVP